MNDVLTPLLQFALTTDPDPPQASPKTGNARKLSLTFVMSAPPHAEVYCDRVTFHFDIGPKGTQDSAYLTSVGDGIVASPVGSADEWDLDEGASKNGTFSFKRTSDDTKVEGQGYSFRISGIYVSPVVGTATIRIVEHSSEDGTTFDKRETDIGVPKFPATFGSVFFESDAASVEPGNTGVTLSWQGDDTAKYALTRNGVKVKGEKVEGKDNKPVTSPWQSRPLNEDTVFVLTVSYATADGVSVSRDYYVPVLVRNPVVSLMGPKDAVRVGDPITLTWHKEAVEHCTIEGPGLARKNVDRLHELVVRPKRGGDLAYRLRGTTASGNTIESDFTAKVLPKAPKSDAQLALIKTSGNKDGKVVIRVANGAGRFQKGPADLATGWTEADSSSGLLAIGDYQRTAQPSPDLLYVKLPHTKGGSIELHGCRSPQHGQGDDFWFPLPLPWWLVGLHLDEVGGVPGSTWLIAPMRDPNWDPPVLAVVAVQTADTRGNVDVYYTTTYRPMMAMVGPWSTAYPIADASKGTWRLADMDGDGLPLDLVFVQTAGTKSGHVELSYATGNSHYTQLGPKVVTGFSTKQAANGSWHMADMTGDKKPDLVFVKTAKTASKRVELYWAEAAKGYKKPVGGFTRFDVSQGPTGTWCVLGVGAPKFPMVAPIVLPDPVPVPSDRRVGPRGATE